RRGGAHGGGELRRRGRIDLEASRKVRPEIRLVAFRIKRRLATLRRGEHDIVAGVLECVKGGGKLLKPEAGLPAGVAELVMRGENHKDFQDFLLLVGGLLSVSVTSPGCSADKR